MSHQMFDEAVAEAYDDRFKKLAVFRDALQLVTRLALSELPEHAHVLSVGAGTGAELLTLAEAFPSWRFTAVEPSAPMLDRCKARAAAAGITQRCMFHHGTTDSLEAPEPFDGATALLVSQFVVDREARVSFFREISRRLKSGAPLVSADLAQPEPAGDLRELWKRAWLYNDLNLEAVERMLTSIGEHVAVVPPDDVSRVISEGGFDSPARVFQTVWIHGWLSRRKS